MTARDKDPAHTEGPTSADVDAAAELIRGHVLRTPMLAAPKLSDLTGAEVFVKYENLQITNSFKDRGALVKLMSLTEEQRARGVVAMSAGNHAQAVAYHSARLGIPATIVMPKPTPFVKVGNTEALGARVVLAGATVSDSQSTAEVLAREQGLTFVHPFDDARIIAGQGTVALEIIEDCPDLEALIVPIGGGGLISGCALALASRAPHIELIGVEAAMYPSMQAVLTGQTPRFGGQTLAEGIAVKSVGHLTRAIVRHLVSDIILVDEDALEEAVCAFLTLQKTQAEGAGAAPLAAIMSDPGRFAGRKVGLVLGGGNIDPRILSSIMLRGLERDDKIICLRLTISDEPGQLGRIATYLGESGANILEVAHSRLLLEVPAKGASVDVMIEVKHPDHAKAIIDGLARQGLAVQRLSGLAAREHGMR